MESPTPRHSSLWPVTQCRPLQCSSALSCVTAAPWTCWEPRRCSSYIISFPSSSSSLSHTFSLSLCFSGLFFSALLMRVAGLVCIVLLPAGLTLLTGAGWLVGWGVGVDNDSCSVYGTGRIHCESSLSVNYHRAINRAEKEPLDDARPHRLTVSLVSSAALCCAGGWGECVM